MSRRSGREPLLPQVHGVNGAASYTNNGFQRRPRTLSSSSLDPNEDPVTGLERVASLSQLSGTSNIARRRLEDEIQHTREVERRMRGRSTEDECLNANFESLNYEISENQLYKEEELSPKHSNRLWQSSISKWIACFFIGLCTACVAASIDIMVHYSKDFKFGFILKGLLAKCDKETELTGASCLWMVEGAWIAYNCVLVGFAAILVLFVSPIAGGSGIPQIKCYLNGIQVPDVVRLKTLLAKMFGVAGAVAGGLSAGKEGPMIHSGACVGSGISQGRSKTLNIDTGLFKQFRNDREKRDFVSAGAAAGVAAAFGAPIGGVLFSLEEGASFWNQNLTWRMFFTALVSSFTVNFILSTFNGRSGLLSWNGLANFGVFENKDYNVWELPFFIIIGIFGGLTGALFNHLNLKLSEFRKKYVANKWQRLLECLLVAAVSAFTGFLTLFVIDDCQPVGINPNMTEVNQMWCKKGEYSAVANLFFTTPEENVKSLFHSPINSFRPSTLIIFAIEYFFLTLWTFGISVPSGIFIPALLTGAAWGRLFGIGVSQIVPSITGIDPGKYALAGAAAQLGGICRMTISLTAIIMEATRQITFGLPIMIVLMVAKWVGDLFNEGIYDLHIGLAEVPVLGWNPPKMSRNINAEKVMRCDVVAVERRERVARIVEMLRTTSHHGFPVVDRIEESTTQSSQLPDYGHLKGMILRSQLIVLLEKKVFGIEADDMDGIRTIGSVSVSDFDDDDSGMKGVDEIGLNREDEQCWIDLEPYMHPHPHRVPLNASLPFIFRLFRGLGLRYLAVVNDDNKLRGIITRKDVSRFREHRSHNRYRVMELFISEDRSH